jgi:hypothetical protein
MPRGSTTPAGSGLHSPSLPGWLHDTHELAQAMLQQIPSTQLPVKHSVAPAHAAPFGFLPQVL